MSPRGVEGHLRHLDHDGRGRGRLFDLFLELFVEISSQKLKFKLFAAGNPIVHRQAKSGTRARRVRLPGDRETRARNPAREYGGLEGG